MAQTFTAQVGKIIATNQKRLKVLAIMSMEDTVNEAQTPVAKGGKMRVDTGFLRASGQMSLNGLPTGPIRGDADKTYSFDDDSVVTKLSGFDLGMTIYFAWSAKYARVRNFYDGYRDAAVQNWKKTVARNAAKIRRYVK